MISPRILIPLLLVPFALAGCGAVTSAGGSSSGATPSGISHPTGADDVVIQVTSDGGYVPLEVTLRAVPQFTLYGDGTVIVPGPVVMKYPGPAIYPLRTFTLSEPEVQALLTAVKDAGLLEAAAPDYGDMGSVGVSDQATTTLLVNADGASIRRSAYALTFESNGSRLTDAQARARRALAGFINDLPMPTTDAAYTPARLAVYVMPVQGDLQMGARPAVWPLETDLATAGTKLPDWADHRCIAVDGEDAQTLVAALSDTNELTQWLPRANADIAYRLVARPLLPGEVAC
jgi:hypothetical protein